MNKFQDKIPSFSINDIDGISIAKKVLLVKVEGQLSTYLRTRNIVGLSRNEQAYSLLLRETSTCSRAPETDWVAVTH